MRQYFLPYLPEAKKFNYLPVLCFWIIAEYDKKTKLYDGVKFASLDDLAEKIASKVGEKILSKSTLSRALNNSDYVNFFSYDRNKKRIELKNNFRKATAATEKAPFVVLSEAEIFYLARSGDSLLIQYFLYLRYYCGLSKSKTTDTTAKQFLAGCGYCATSNSYLSKIAGYNGALSALGFISITKSRDINGRERNEYKC